MKYLLKLFFILSFICLITSESISQILTIHHLDVGQGDATLIRVKGGKTVLIDAGNTGKGKDVVFPYLRNLGITSLDFIVASHYHSDHIGGLDEVIQSFPKDSIRSILDRGYNPPLPKSKAFTDYWTAANQTHHHSTITLGQVLDLGNNITLQCIAVNGSVLHYGEVPSARLDENNLSVAWLLSFEKVIDKRKYTFRYFTGGDCGGVTSNYADLETPLASIVDDIDVMKINHHGSRYSSNRIFLQQLNPEAVVISVGDNNRYGHPAQEVIDRLENTKSIRYIYQTEQGVSYPERSRENHISKKVKVLGTVKISVFDSFYTIDTDTFTLVYKDRAAKVSEPKEQSSNISLEYKNPIQKGGSLTLSLGEETDISIKLFNILGKIISILDNTHLPAGIFQIHIDRESLSSGIYFISLETQSEKIFRKVIYLQ
jgi:beta-lactamase superfamily II metal-dependent hydrolase